MNKHDSYATFGENKLTDFTDEELDSLFGVNVSLDDENLEVQNFADNSLLSGAYNLQPDAIDWRALGKVHPVRDQGPCGSCWAISAVQTLEAKIPLEAEVVNL